MTNNMVVDDLNSDRWGIIETNMNHAHPDLQLDPLVVAINRLHLEVDAHGADERVAEGVVGVAEQEGRFPHAAVADDQQLEHVVKVLVGAVPLAETLVCLRHLDVWFDEGEKTQLVSWKLIKTQAKVSLQTQIHFHYSFPWAQQYFELTANITMLTC